MKILARTVCYQLPPARPFQNRHINLLPCGLLIIHAGYGWDCTHAPVDTPACILHDAGYQFLVRAGIYTRKQVDTFFLEAMLAERFVLAWPYFFAVRLIGWLYLR